MNPLVLNDDAHRIGFVVLRFTMRFDKQKLAFFVLRSYIFGIAVHKRRENRPEYLGDSKEVIGVLIKNRNWWQRSFFVAVHC